MVDIEEDEEDSGGGPGSGNLTMISPIHCEDRSPLRTPNVCYMDGKSDDCHRSFGGSSDEGNSDGEREASRDCDSFRACL